MKREPDLWAKVRVYRDASFPDLRRQFELAAKGDNSAAVFHLLYHNYAVKDGLRQEFSNVLVRQYRGRLRLMGKIASLIVSKEDLVRRELEGMQGRIRHKLNHAPVGNNRPAELLERLNIK